MNAGGNRSGEDKGFAGLSSMLSDVEGALKDADSHVGKQEQAERGPTLVGRQESAEAAERSQPAASPEIPLPAQAEAQSATASAPQTARTISTAPPAGPAKKGWWIAGIVVVGLVWIYSQSPNPPTSGPVQPTRPPMASSPPSNYSLGRDLGTQPANPEPSNLSEARPSIGTDQVLSPSEIRYCLAEDIRLGAARGVVNGFVDAEVDRFNSMVADYNSRCSRFRYRRGTLESLRSEVETARARLSQEGVARFRPPIAQAGTQMPARVAPAPSNPSAKAAAAESSTRSIPQSNSRSDVVARSRSAPGGYDEPLSSRTPSRVDSSVGRGGTQYSNLSAAVAFGSVQEIQDWLSRGYDIEGERGEPPPIVTAARYQRYEVVEWLLRRGARVDHADQQGWTAMYYARVNSDARMVDLLSSAGAKNPFK